MVCSKGMWRGKHLLQKLLSGLSLMLLLGWACGGAPTHPNADKCPEAPGEFHPTDCALVRGVARNTRGEILRDLPVMVDSSVRLVGYAYASAPAQSGADGSFELTVFRINRMKPLTVPDTATVEIKAYAAMPSAGDSAIARYAVKLHFAELGAQTHGLHR